VLGIIGIDKVAMAAVRIVGKREFRRFDGKEEAIAYLVQDQEDIGCLGTQQELGCVGARGRRQGADEEPAFRPLSDFPSVCSSF